MCDPGTIALVATVASSAVSAYSSIQQGRAAYQAGMFNAEVARNNAQNTEDQKQLVSDAAAIERRREGERIRAAKGDLSAKFSAMGVDPLFGTPADLIGDVGTAGRADLSIMGRNEITSLKQLDKEQADYLDSAKMSTSQAKGALTAGYLGAAGDLLNGASSVASHWIQPGTATLDPQQRTGRPVLFPENRRVDLLPIGGHP